FPPAPRIALTLPRSFCTLRVAVAALFRAISTKLSSENRYWGATKARPVRAPPEARNSRRVKEEFDSVYMQAFRCPSSSDVRRAAVWKARYRTMLTLSGIARQQFRRNLRQRGEFLILC